MTGFNPSYTGARPDVVKLVPASCRRILDVGCATGALGQALKAARPAARVTGVELDPEMARVARDRLDEVIEGDIGALVAESGFTARRFDCVVLADVLEHLVDPWTVLASLGAQLEMGGAVVASLPNIRHYTTLGRLLLTKTWPYRDRGIHDRTHLRFFAQRNVAALFQGAGLDITRLRRQYRVLEAPYKINRLARVLAVPPLRDLLTFQYLIVATPHPRPDVTA